MTRRTIALVVLLLLATAGGGQAQDSYTLKLKDTAQGDSYLFRHNDNIKTTSKVVDDQGNSQKTVNDTRSKAFAFVESIVQKPAGEALPTALRRGYRKAVVTWNDRTQTLPLDGLAVLIDRKDDKYEYRLEGGGKLTPEDIAELDLDFNKRSFNFLAQDILPDKAVKLKESWSLDPAVVFKAMTKDELQKIDLDKAKISARLVKVYDNNKSQFGVVEFQFELPLAVGAVVKSSGAAPSSKGFKILGGKLIIQGTFDGCIDGSLFARSTKATMNYELRGSNEDNLMTVLMALTASGTLEQSWEDMKK
jgi:hypothetical protein